MTKRTLTLGRFKELVEAYGANLDRWPEAERADAVSLAGTSPEADHWLAEARQLDGLLHGKPPVEVSASLRAAVAAIPARYPRAEAVGAWWPFQSVWRPVVTLLASAICGLSSGWLSAADEADVSTATTTTEAGVQLAGSATDLESLVSIAFGWDVEPLDSDSADDLGDDGSTPAEEINP